MGVCGAPSGNIAEALDAMQEHIGTSGGPKVDRWENSDLGLLRYHHGVINSQPQPVVSADGELLAAMDGEILNAAELGGPAGRGDAELVLDMYERQGENAFSLLSGSYSILIKDVPSHRLLLVTDPFFSRPVYYVARNGMLFFSSRMNALVACGALAGGRLDMTSVMQMFTFQHSQFESTHYTECRAMLPGEVLEFRDGRVLRRRYHRLRYGPGEGSFDDYVERLCEALRRSALRATRDGLRMGVMLSGGLDARTLVAASPAPMIAYTVSDTLNREVRLARRIAQAKGWPHVFLPRSRDHYARLLDEAVELSGGMGRFDDAHFLGQLDRPAAECDVLFNEELMDAMVKGYYWDHWLSIKGVRIPLPSRRSFSRVGIERQIMDIDGKGMMRDKPWLLLREPWRSRFTEMMCASVREQIVDSGTTNLYNMVEHVCALGGLGRVASFMNVTCVRSRLAYRSMCLDRELLDLCVRTPVRYRAGGRLLKAALKRLDPRLYAIPYSNTGMRPDTPEPISWAYRMGVETVTAARKKLGLLPRTYANEGWPDRSEMLRTPMFRALLEQTFFDVECFPPEVFDAARLRELVDHHMTRRRHYMRMLLCLLSFGRWFKRFGPGTV